ncbi:MULTISPECIES: hypothetical protein [unclassified Pseudomonas]|uniref:hypothetical protein n=1 Tax=unclassified Pseudomonas TaxID=196821 RepID=UPI00244871A3|nr:MULTISPECIES: hypothetical protein [unclassified Pseudomonas]MDG9924049.1 hypothetical protein [Pseudomonas sp. GD04045]MDH0034964.1 hypothetical protein [Pseudomonas sp. GD04019]
MRARRKWLVVAALTLSAVGVFGLARLLGGAMGLPANAGEQLERIDVSHLPPGHFAGPPATQARSWSYLILHMHDGSFRAFAVRLEDGRVAVPERFWGGNTAYPCESFGPAPTPGAFPPDAAIECHLPPPAGWRHRRWDLQGRSLNREVVVEDLYEVPVHLEAGGFLVLGKSI